MAKQAGTPSELPRDNGARIALYDAAAAADPDGRGLDEEELFTQVIPRLRVLVPQELHIQGEREYFHTKLDAAIEAGNLARLPGGQLLALGDQPPFIQYPDGSIRPYTKGLEAARERLDADDSKLRNKGYIVTKYLKSVSARSPEFKALVESMREHGFITAMPLIESSTGELLDGRARLRAAEELDIHPKKIPRVTIDKHRDSPLQQTVLVMDVNARRTDPQRDELIGVVTDITGRSWADIRSDLALTQEWRQTKPKRYTAWLDVELVPFRAGEREGTGVEVTTDRTKVAVKSLLQQVGFPEWRRKDLREFAPFEQARSNLSKGGNKTDYVRVGDAIDGIAAMQAHRERSGHKVDRRWDEIRQWLVDTFGVASP